MTHNLQTAARRSALLLAALFVLSMAASAQKAKYVFYFIGDGMGVNQVNGTEMYYGELQGKIGTQPLTFASFPVACPVTTFSATNGVTDSAAGGTALATGVKTYNSAIGVDKDGKNIYSVAERAKKAGYRVGVTTSVSVDHATPASFYAHQAKRQMYYEIATDLPKAGLDFYAGSGFLSPTKSYEGKDMPDVRGIIEQAGYTIARGTADYRAKRAAAKKMVLIQPEGADNKSLPYALDRKPGDMTLSQITESAVDFLTRDPKSKGFFLMVEGGKIDWACHANDAATVFREVKDMDDAVQVAYAFYKKHPKETLIVIAADHETGGIVLGVGPYELRLKNLARQNASLEQLSHAVTDLRMAKDKQVTWEDAKALLAEKMGFWSQLPMTWEEERTLHDDFEESFVKHTAKAEESLYASTEPLAASARRIMAAKALVGWTSGGHSDGYIPLFSVGVGSSLFHGRIDNTVIAPTIMRAMGIK